jgi:NADPH2:quinone reductase
MKAVGLTRYLPIGDPASLLDLNVPPPGIPTGADLLVRVHAVSVNPVDTKQRAPRAQQEDPPRILGYDAAGVVDAVGPEVTAFLPGDEVYYAGDVTRPGCNAQWQWVDERLVGRKPATLDFADAAALPLTALTAWELLFQRMPLQFDDRRHAGQVLLVIGGAGGVGSIAIQLARHAGFTVVATASREASAQWCRQMGAHHVIDHRHPLPAQLQALDIAQVHVALNLADTDRYWDVLGGAAGTAGACGPDRRAARCSAHRRPVQGQVHRDPLGIHVRPRQVPHCGQDRTAPHPEPGSQPGRRRRAAQHAQCAPGRDQCGQPAPGPPPIGKRQHDRQAGAVRLGVTAPARRPRLSAHIATYLYLSALPRPTYIQGPSR